ncbi:MAG: hypothetical protein WBA43_20750 [Elainellaceae cyanobacterium]
MRVWLAAIAPRGAPEPRINDQPIGTWQAGQAIALSVGCTVTIR